VIELTDVFHAAVKETASDIIITTGAPPTLRIEGQLFPLKTPDLGPEDAKTLVYSMLTEGQIARFEADKELDFSFTLKQQHRFRGNVFYQRGSVAASFRLIPQRIPKLEELNLPPILGDFALTPQGLILVTGPTGHGKSTTQAAMIDLINTTKRAHIITIEDPIEYIHENRQSIVEQREVGQDTKSFGEALRHVLRETPDVIQVGEMRDPESIACALTAAETGHMVIATLHTNDAVQAIDRLIDVFPAHQQTQVRAQLSLCLLAVIAQRLLPRKGYGGLIPAVEILRASSGVSHLIRDHKTHQLYSLMETKAKEGMKTLDAALKELYLKGEIRFEDASSRMRNPKLLDRK
jgi:twitching motility protein PilT